MDESNAREGAESSGVPERSRERWGWAEPLPTDGAIPEPVALDSETSGPSLPGASRAIDWDFAQWETQSADRLPADRPPRSDWKALLYEIVETLVLTLLIFVLMRALVQNYRIEGFSMEPNLQEGQRLFVNKLPYYFGEPERGDIVVFEFPRGDPNGPEKDYIKRIIGLPGETIECRPGEILVNGALLPEPYRPNPHSYHCATTKLGPDEYYVLGDNRNSSSDSSNWGPLERKYIIGKAWLLYLPLEDFGIIATDTPTHSRRPDGALELP